MSEPLRQLISGGPAKVKDAQAPYKTRPALPPGDMFQHPCVLCTRRQCYSAGTDWE